MPALSYKPSSPWENKFRTPRAEDLLSGLARPLAQVFESARQRLRESAAGVREEIVWQGLPWHWTFAYRAEGEAAARIYLVPEPGKPRMVIPISAERLGRVPLRKLSKPAREALAHGVEVDGLHWTEWDLSSRALLDEAMALVCGGLNGAGAMASAPGA